MSKKEYIERGECRDDFYASALNILSGDSTNDRANQIIDVFDDLFTADVKSVKHGRNENEKYASTDEFRCSECGIHLEDWTCFKYEDELDFDCCEFEFKFCPNCGVKIMGENI